MINVKLENYLTTFPNFHIFRRAWASQHRPPECQPPDGPSPGRGETTYSNCQATRQGEGQYEYSGLYLNYLYNWERCLKTPPRQRSTDPKHVCRFDLLLMKIDVSYYRDFG